MYGLRGECVNFIADRCCIVNASEGVFQLAIAPSAEMSFSLVVLPITLEMYSLHTNPITCLTSACNTLPPWLIGPVLHKGPSQTPSPAAVGEENVRFV